MKHYLTIFSLIILFFAGCGGGKKQNREIVFAVGGAPSEINFWEALVDEFQTEYKIDVTVIRQPTNTDQRRQSLVVSLKAHDKNPDVFLMDVAWLAQIAASDWLTPLGPFIEKTNYDTSVFFSNILNLADMYSGQLLALPVFVDGGLLYYRTDLLDSIGIDKPPQLWSELVDYSEKVQKMMRETNPEFYSFAWQGAQYEGLVCNFLEYAVSNNGGFEFKGDSLILSTPQNIEALQFMVDLIHKYKISPPNTYTEFTEEPVRIFFQQGNALFERNWAYAWLLAQSPKSPVRDKVGMSPLPHFPDGKSVATLGGWHIGISKYSDVKDDAWKFVEYVTSYETQKKLALNLGWNPGRKDLYGDADILERLPYFAELEKVLEHAYPRPTRPYYPQMSQVLQKYLNSALAGTISPEEALKSSEKEIQDIIDRYE